MASPGFLVDSDAASLANGLRVALDVEPSALAVMGQQARHTSEQCTWGHAVQAYLDIYGSVLSRIFAFMNS